MPASNHHPLIDIGVNLTSPRFATDMADVIARAREQQVVHAVVTGTSIAESHSAVDLTRQYPGYLSCTAGQHPHGASGWTEESAAVLRVLLSDPAVVAVGECGLDFNRDFSPRTAQEACFAAQLAVAVEAQKPVFLHERDAHDRFAAILRQFRENLPGAVVHCFTGDKAELRYYLDLGCHIGITGWLCDERRGDALRDAIRYLPLDRLMLETDAPYLTPRTIRPRPRKGRNEPAFLPYVLAALSEYRGCSMEELATAALANSCQFFGLEIDSDQA